MSDTFSVSPSSSVGNVFLTEFTFQSTVSSATSFAWDFGDTVYSYKGPSTSHIYQYPGTYTVSNSAWINDGSEPYISSQDIYVDYVYSNNVIFSQIPSSYGVPGQRTNEPFVVSLTCTEIYDSLYLVLQSLNATSTPITYVPPKWQFITPKWQFVDATSNKVVTDGILVKTSPLYQINNGVPRVVAVSGTASFYYIDDLATQFNGISGAPLLLVATLSTENFVYPLDSQIYSYNSYANSDSAKAAVLWQVGEYFPTNLKVTENFISEVYPTKWTNVPISTMVTCQFDSRLNSNFTNTDIITANLLGYPKTNDIGSMFPVSLNLSNNEPFVVESSAAYFTNTDKNSNPNSGYVYTSVTPLVSSGDPITIIASTTAVELSGDSTNFAFPNGYPIYSNAYICNPYDGVVNKLALTNYPQANNYVEYYKDLGVLTDGKLDIWNLPYKLTNQGQSIQTLSAAQVYGVAFDPILNVTYVCNPITGNIDVFDKNGVLKFAPVNLSYVLGGESANPCCIAVDNNHNIWVSLYGEETLLKLDSNLNVLYTAEPSTYTEEEQLVAPPAVETDLSGNLWACYAELSAGYLVHFNLSGSELLNIPLSSYSSLQSVPVSLAVDINNSVWVACYNSNMILNFSTEGTLLRTLSGGFTRPNNLAIDRSNNVWFTHGYNFISEFNVTTSSLNSWQISTLSASALYTTELQQISSIPTENEMWGGLSIDVYNRVWAIDSKTNNVLVFNAENISNIRVISTQPSLSTIAIALPVPVSGIDVPTSIIHASQATGDWTGNKWYQKYAVPAYTVPINGTSAPFTVFNLDGTYSVAKVNEEFDISAYFHSLALPESLSQNTLFFNEFLAAVAGDGNPTKESAGRVIYERIANFIQTHGDFETSEIDQLLSYAAQLSVDAKTYGIDFPAEINRLVNIFSVSKNSLRGRINYDPNFTNSIGPLLTQSETVSAGQYLFAKEKSSNSYQSIYVTALSNGLKIYPLSSLNVAGFKTPLVDNYYFFQHLQTTLGYTENIINWDSLYTTFDYTLSSNQDWYGDNGLVETMFNNILTKRLTE